MNEDSQNRHIFTAQQYSELGTQERYALLLLAKQIEPTTNRAR